MVIYYTDTEQVILQLTERWKEANFIQEKIQDECFCDENMR